MFSIRAVVLDHYISKSVTELYEKNGTNHNGHWLEPVIRIFGCTPNGTKSCIHVHGVYPYIYVPYKGGDNPNRDALILGAALEEALKITYNQHKSKFVHKVTVASGIPLYGYHSTYRQFFKIFFYNPYHIKKASELLLNGAVLGQKLQPHESHIPYILQFMIDYNIYGMSFVNFSKIKYRRNPDDTVVDASKEMLSDKVLKLTCCSLEADALAIDIINRTDGRGLNANPGLRGIWQSERNRRKEQNLPTQFTAEKSLSRHLAEVHAAELMYKERLSIKLRDIVPVAPVTAESSGESNMTYPAEVPESCNLLEASALFDGFEFPSSDSENLPDITQYLDEKVLSQQMEDETADEHPENTERIEDESILGKGRNERDEEAELEKDEDDGGDMTQPLDVEEDVAAPSVSDSDAVIEANQQEEFWLNMADRILQIDGAHDSSSDSDVDSILKPTTESTTAIPVTYVVERDFTGDSTRCHQIIGSSESTTITTNVSNSILTFLSEASRTSVPLIISQPLAASWSTFSPKADISLAPPVQMQESWSWEKNDVPLSDWLPASKTQISSACDFAEPAGKKSSEDSNSADSLRGLFEPNNLFDSYGDMPSLSPCSNIASTYSESSPTSGFSSPPSFEAYSDVNMNSISDVGNNSCKVTFEPDSVSSALATEGPNSERVATSTIEGKTRAPDSTSDKSVSLTLKEYLKDFGEIVNVNLKNFNEREMVVIEYTPSGTAGTCSNKFIIKPLDKFLENWNKAEKKLNNKVSEEKKKSDNPETDISRPQKKTESKTCHRKRGRNQENSETSTAKIQSAQPKKLKENSLKKGKTNEISCQSCNSNKNKMTDGKASDEENRIRCENKLDELILNKWKENPQSSPKRKRLNLDENNRKSLQDERNVNLINRINSCFEDYFRNVVKVNNVWGSNSNNLLKKGRKNYEEEDDEDDDDPYTAVGQNTKIKRFARSLAKDEGKKKSNSSSEDSKSVKMVAQLLSEFSKMSQTHEMPPLHITINIGNQSDEQSVRFEANTASRNAKCERDRGKFRTGKSKKFRIPNLDGAADTSSSEDLLDSPPSSRKSVRDLKKTTKGSKNDDLNILLNNSQTEMKKIDQRKRKRSKNSSAEEEKTGSSSRKDSLIDYSENWLMKESKQLKSSNRGMEKLSLPADFGQNVPSTSSKAEISRLQLSCSIFEDRSKGEPDVIYDSDDGIRSMVVTAKRKIKKFKSSRGGKLKSKGIEKPFENLESETLKSTTLAAENDAVVKDDEELTCSQLDNTFNFSISELDKTKYRIPSRWFETEKSEEQKAEVVKESSNDSSSVGMSLSGSPLCSPANNSVPASESLSSGQSDLNLNLTPQNQVELDSSASSSVTLKPEDSPEHFLSISGLPRSLIDLDQAISLTQEKVVCPKRKPPTANEVRSFVISNRHVKEEMEVPFYGDIKDLTKAVEAGPMVLKVETVAYAGLKSFKSSLNLLGIEERRALLLKTRKNENFRHLLLPDRDIVITPLKKPPSKSVVMKSLEVKKGMKSGEKEKSKTKVAVPVSPGQESMSEEEIDVSLSVSTFKDEDREELSGSLPPSGKVSNVLAYQKDQVCKELGSDKDETYQASESVKNQSISGGKTVCSNSDTSSTELILKEQVQNSDNSYQIRGPTLDNTFGFDNSVENLQNVKSGHSYQYITMLVMEVHVKTREDLRPDPQHDPIQAIFYTITFDSPTQSQETGIIVVGDFPLTGRSPSLGAVHRVPKEIDLLSKIVDLVKVWDPDILAGYEIELHSWGYLIQRGSVLEFNLFSMLGRILESNYKGDKGYPEKEDFEDIPSSIKNIRIPGRIVLDIWRVLRHEVSLTSYTFENVIYHLSHERHPLLSYRDLSFYWDHPSNRYRHITLNYYLTRVTGIVRILDQLDFINRTSEFARLFGIQFYEVLSRGSQFRVESMMLRLAKPQNYVPVSPNVRQRAAMRAPASLPLILEPESAFYADPLIVLDFQSLYPSMIIAYNYCFSTCLGRVEKLGGREPFEFGCTQLLISPEELKALENDISISPAGVAFVKENVRKGILPTMLEEILETRLMVKKSMKTNKENKLLQKVLFAQQLGLKLIANVTYGYTAANFSGRMPSIEVGDSVVSKGRETLHRAIQLVKGNSKWKARVVYGDTDSIFVLTPGRTRAEAFQIGAEIAEAVTRDNPKPVKLKLEKVYQPSILQTKKRYVGYMYESLNQSKPIFEAKGIETVRRDGCPAVGKILQKALDILFETRDVSLVKKYTVRQFSKLFQGRVNIQDLIFAKEYRGRSGYRPGACVPALQLARQWTRVDKRAEPRVKERVPYVIVSGPPGVPLIKLVRSPMDLITDPGLHINAFYYITKAIIPPLHRCLTLMGVDVSSWYTEMPKKYKKRYQTSLPRDHKKTTISQYFSPVECLVCSNITTSIICQECQVRPQVCAVTLTDRIRLWERCSANIAKICQCCCKNPKEFDCTSMDCPVLFRKNQASRDLLRIPGIREALEELMGGKNEDDSDSNSSRIDSIACLPTTSTSENDI